MVTLLVGKIKATKVFNSVDTQAASFNYDKLVQAKF